MIVAADLVARHQVLVDVVELGAPFPHALHVSHDSAVLCSDHQATYYTAVVCHVCTESLPCALELLSFFQKVFDLFLFLGEAAHSGKVLNPKVGPKRLHKIPCQVHAVARYRERALPVHIEEQARIVSQNQEFNVKLRFGFQLLGEEKVLVNPHDNPLSSLLDLHRHLALRFDSLLRGFCHQMVHRETGQLAGELEHMEVGGGLVPYEGLDVQIHGDVLGRDDGDGGGGRGDLGVHHVALTLDSKSSNITQGRF